MVHNEIKDFLALLARPLRAVLAPPWTTQRHLQGLFGVHTPNVLNTMDRIIRTLIITNKSIECEMHMTIQLNPKEGLNTIIVSCIELIIFHLPYMV